jgi:hypothetical protein
MKDVLWFCVILLTLVVSFAQMFYTLLIPQSCAESLSENNSTDVEDINAERQCKQSEYYLRAYTVLLGDFGSFERDEFTSLFSVLLIVAYSFLVVLILLNVLIAVASESYEKCLLRSERLFGRARVMLIAELVSFQNLLYEPRKDIDHSIFSAQIFKPWWNRRGATGRSRGSVVFFGLALLVTLIWVAGESVGYLSGARIMSLGSILITVALFVAILLFLSKGADYVDSDNDDGSHKGTRTSSPFEEWYKTFVQHAMLRLLGFSLKGFSGSEHGGDGWRGRLTFLQREMQRTSESTRDDFKWTTNNLESSLVQTEARLLQHMSAIEQRLDEIRSTLSSGAASAG